MGYRVGVRVGIKSGVAVVLAAMVAVGLLACAERSSDHTDGRPPRPRATPVVGPVSTTTAPPTVSSSGICARFEALGRDGIVQALGEFVVDPGEPGPAAVPPATSIDPYIEASHCALEFGDRLGQQRRSLVTVVEQHYADASKALLGSLRGGEGRSLAFVEDIDLGDDSFRYTFLLNSPPTAIKAVYGVWIQDGATRYRITIRENQPEVLTEPPPEESARHEALMRLVDLLGPWD